MKGEGNEACLDHCCLSDHQPDAVGFSLRALASQLEDLEPVAQPAVLAKIISVLRDGAHEREEHEMSTPIPREVDDFLVTLGTYEDNGAPEAFEEFAKTTANLLWGKYVLLAGPSDPIVPTLRIDLGHHQ